ncbi:hypothetical protein QYF36_014879 [Acer negundo]|nr:hypothetical protein QYF36_014879 [Acer negundo]
MQSMQAIMLSMQSFMTNQRNVSHIHGRDGSGDVSFNGERCDRFQEEVQAMGYQQRDMSGVISQTYNPKWRNNPNLSWTNNNVLNSNMLSREVNQGFNNNRGYYQDGQRLSSLEALVANMGASMKNMETQMGQIAESLQKQDKGKFPSQPEQAKAMTVLRRGWILENGEIRENACEPIV